MQRLLLLNRLATCEMKLVRVRPLLLLLCWFAAGISAPASAQGTDWTAEYGRLLGKYATPNGVRYAAWKSNAADVQALQTVVDAIASQNTSGLGQKEQLAFYLNAYNAWVVHEVLEKYPTKTVKDTLYTFFTGKRIKVAGEEMSLNRLEKEIIIPRFKEPRVHVALNCASQSCPPLLAEPFRADKLDAQLERLTKGFVNSERGVRVAGDDKSAELSKIFEWYKDDFAAGRGAVAFINKRRNTPLPDGVKISYQDYDWALNEAK
ncbi:MAG TPA: DUF547 domain-containing protein [Chthoniobacterales bacterium]|nr:DUF547 domain-containing protein [Chthoniobacterales bacterium]